MRRSFHDAVAKKPCILFIDEIDGIGDRATIRGQYDQYWVQVVNSLLELVDGFEKHEGVVLVAATNFPEKIDPALRRAGRLDRHVAIPLPDASARRALCQRYLRKDLSDVDVDRIVSLTEGMTGADFEQMGRDVRRRARRARVEPSSELILGALPPVLKISGERRRTVAVHEAGHAVVGLHLGVGKLERVVVHDTVARGRSAAGHTHFVLDDAKERDRQTFLGQIAMLLGGRLAEEVILGTAFEGSGGAGSDIQKATDLATFMDVQLAMGETVGYFSANSSADLEALRRDVASVRERVEKVLLKEWQRARAIVEQHEKIIVRLADKLELEGCASGIDVERMMSRRGRASR
ncbi:ATP-dependent Zn protease [Rhizobium sp. OAE497]